jgi:hypothetical protein
LIAEMQTRPVRERLRTLNHLAAALDRDVELGIRRLASQNDRVAAVLAEADAARMDYIAGLHLSAGLSEGQATRCSRVEYAAFVGAQHLWPRTEPGDWEQMGNFLSQLIKGYRDEQGNTAGEPD